MLTENIPDIYINQTSKLKDLFVYDLKMQHDTVKAKVNLTKHMFSFLQVGKKQMHLAKDSVKIDNGQSLLIKKGNCIWSELIGKEESYHCRLLFFSEKKLKEFLSKHTKTNTDIQETRSHFVIQNDSYIETYLNSLSTIISAPPLFMDNLLSIKFEELLLYLLNKYKKSFEKFLHSLITTETSLFDEIVKNNIYSNLSLDEIAFLTNMSLSTFKRNFIKKHGTSPGKWFKNQRLLKAKELLSTEQVKPSEIYSYFGYNNLSNFSIAFKNKFGVNPSEI